MNFDDLEEFDSIYDFYDVENYIEDPKYVFYTSVNNNVLYGVKDDSFLDWHSNKLIIEILKKSENLSSDEEAEHLCIDKKPELVIVNMTELKIFKSEYVVLQ